MSAIATPEFARELPNEELATFHGGMPKRLDGCLLEPMYTTEGYRIGWVLVCD